jgi:hypothetical protein
MPELAAQIPTIIKNLLTKIQTPSISEAQKNMVLDDVIEYVWKFDLQEAKIDWEPVFDRLLVSL